MDCLKHLIPKKIHIVANRLYVTESSLKGISGLFSHSGRDLCLDPEEYYGTDNLLGALSAELQFLGDILRCGYDSMADERNGIEGEKCA